jgi:nitrite reductase/ring-hydroxylating ferredoxin subunit
MGLAKDTFRVFVTMRDSGQVGLETLLRGAYEAAGWPERFVVEDMERLSQEHIDNVDLLKRVMEEGYSYKIQIPAVSMDLLAAKLGLPLKLRFSIDDTSRPLVESIMKNYEEPLALHRFQKTEHFSLISKKGWKKLDLPKGIKIRIEDATKALNMDILSERLAGTNLTGDTPCVPNRMTVIAADGKKYEADRYCPHKGVDLVGASIDGALLVCPKHRWKFDLSQGGKCVEGKNPCTINAVPLDW